MRTKKLLTIQKKTSGPKKTIFILRGDYNFSKIFIFDRTVSKVYSKVNGNMKLLVKKLTFDYLRLQKWYISIHLLYLYYFLGLICIKETADIFISGRRGGARS